MAKRGDRFAATEPICDASGHFQGALRLRAQTYAGLDARGLRECHAGDGSMIS
ncbi:MAG: hypothetical protein RDU83_08415 [bacterium]|nr:hypothetical protein [bacterium]